LCNKSLGALVVQNNIKSLGVLVVQNNIKSLGVLVVRNISLGALVVRKRTSTKNGLCALCAKTISDWYKEKRELPEDMRRAGGFMGVSARHWVLRET